MEYKVNKVINALSSQQNSGSTTLESEILKPLTTTKTAFEDDTMTTNVDTVTTSVEATAAPPIRTPESTSFVVFDNEVDAVDYAAVDLIAVAAADAVATAAQTSVPAIETTEPVFETSDLQNQHVSHLKRKFFRDIAKSCMTLQGEFLLCTIDASKQCCYKQAQSKYDAGNFIRHLRIEHATQAKERGLMKDSCDAGPAVKKRKINKISVPIDTRLMWTAVLKLLTEHNMPLHAVEWEGLRLIFDPICNALGICINRKTAVEILSTAAGAAKEKIAAAIKSKLLTVQIDSASRHGRHILGVSVSFLYNEKVIVRTIDRH